MRQDQFEQDIVRIPSLFTQRHAHVIYGLVRWLQPNTVVEIGSYAGYMTCWMAQAISLSSNSRAHLYAVDDWSLGTTAQMLHNHLSKFELADKVTILNPPEFIASDLSVDFAFIDGDHSKDGCYQDLQQCMLRGAQCIVLHDSSSWWGVSEVVQGIRERMKSPRPSPVLVEGEGYDILQVCFDEGLTILMRQQDPIPVKYTQEKYPKGHV